MVMATRWLFFTSPKSSHASGTLGREYGTTQNRFFWSTSIPAFLSCSHTACPSREPRPWFSYSAADNECVEVSCISAWVGIRHFKASARNQLIVSADAYVVFISSVKDARS
ncbi:DUF397 domain-containing protein [Streptomyces coeruleorubidus]